MEIGKGRAAWAWLPHLPGVFPCGWAGSVLFKWFKRRRFFDDSSQKLKWLQHCGWQKGALREKKRAAPQLPQLLTPGGWKICLASLSSAAHLKLHLTLILSHTTFPCQQACYEKKTMFSWCWLSGTTCSVSTAPACVWLTFHSQWGGAASGLSYLRPQDRGCGIFCVCACMRAFCSSSEARSAVPRSHPCQLAVYSLLWTLVSKNASGGSPSRLTAVPQSL